MDDAQAVVQRGLGDQEVRNRRAVPHAVVTGELTLQRQRPPEQTGGRPDGRLDPQRLLRPRDEVLVKLDRRPPRHAYTLAAAYVRMAAGYFESGLLLGRPLGQERLDTVDELLAAGLRLLQVGLELHRLF